MTNEHPPGASCCAGATSAAQPDVVLASGGAGWGLRLGETLDQIIVWLHIKQSHVNNSGIIQGSV